MSATVSLTIKMPLSLKRELTRAAKRRGFKPSEAARAFIKEGLARDKPGALLNATDRIDPSFSLIEAIVARNISEELQTLARINLAAVSIKEIVEMPDAKLKQLLFLLAGNYGLLSKFERASAFAELTDAQVTAIEQAFGAAFNESGP